MQNIREMIGEWIKTAANDAGIRVLQLSGSESAEIVDKLRQRYVLGHPRFWWTAFRTPWSSFNSAQTNISTILPTLAEQVHFIPECATINPRVYEIQAGDIERLIDNCPVFEYTVAALDGSWLLAESHHDTFYLCRD